MFDVTMKVKNSFGVFCIDNLQEHLDLLRRVDEGLISIFGDAIPHRDISKKFFEPYVVEDMEFEFCKFQTPASNILGNLREKLKKNKVNRMIDNVKIYPVRREWEEMLTKMRTILRILGFYSFVVSKVINLDKEFSDAVRRSEKRKEIKQLVGSLAIGLIIV